MLRAGQDDRATRVAAPKYVVGVGEWGAAPGCGVSVAIEPAESVAGRCEDEARSGDAWFSGKFLQHES